MQPPSSPLPPGSAPNIVSDRDSHCISCRALEVAPPLGRTCSSTQIQERKPCKTTLNLCALNADEVTASCCGRLEWWLQHLCGGLQAADLCRPLLLALGLVRLLLRGVRADARHLPLVLRLQAPPRLHLHAGTHSDTGNSWCIAFATYSAPAQGNQVHAGEACRIFACLISQGEHQTH